MVIAYNAIGVECYEETYDPKLFACLLEGVREEAI